MRPSRHLLPCTALLAACSQVPTFECGSIEPIGVEIRPQEWSGPFSSFLWTNGQRWMTVDQDCDLEVWYGSGPNLFETSRPLATRTLTESDIAEIWDGLEIARWLRHEPEDFTIESPRNYTGARVWHRIGDFEAECAFCAKWVQVIDAHANGLISELYLSAEPVGAERPLTVGLTVNWSGAGDGIPPWSVPWELPESPDTLLLIADNDYAGTPATEEQAAWFRSVRNAFLESGRKQEAPVVIDGDNYYWLYMKEW